MSASATPITPAALHELMESDAPPALIDVREWGEFANEQILGARNVGRAFLEKYLPYLVPKRDVKVVLVCDDGLRSSHGAATARSLGYQDVSVLDGGLRAWKSAGGETFGGWSLTGKDFGERLLVEESIPEMSAKELHDLLEKKDRVCILDSRPAGEFRASHLPRAHSAPIGQLALQVTDLVPDGATPIVTNCAGRTRSIIAAHLLRRMRLGNPIYALRGGTGAWRIAGWGEELESGAAAARPAPSASAAAAANDFAERLLRDDRIALVTSAELRALIQSGALVYVLDVRLPDEYVAGHIPGARLCPGTQVQFAVDAQVGVPNATVVTVCDGRVRATVAASILKGMGYRDVRVLDGGVSGWTKDGGALEAGMPYEIDYGEPAWLARFLLELRPSLGTPRELPVAGLPEARSRVRFISSAELARRREAQAGALVIDVRGAGDFALGHIAGARWLSRGWIDLRIGEVAQATDAIILYSRREVRSVLAAATLAEMSYRDVAIVAGGFDGWKEAGLPVEDGLGSQPELEEIAVAEVGLFGGGPFGYSDARMAKYLKDEEALGHRHRGKAAT
jgi:rhodanese-related sulfurtransferase